MRKLHYLLIAAAATTGMVAGLTAQTAPSTMPNTRPAARGGGGGGRGRPHVTAPGIDSRFGAPYSNNAATPFIARPTPNANTPAVVESMTKQAAAAYPDKASWEKRADFLRHQVLAAHGLWPMPPKTPLNPVIHGKIDKGDFTIEKVYFASLPGHYVTGNLYRPKNIPPGTKVPAILHPYGHWPDGRFWWRDDKGVQKELDNKWEVSPISARSPLQDTCMNLASMGCVVFEWDLVGYGDSKGIPLHQDEKGFNDNEAVLRLQSFMGLQTWNSIRSFDFVASLPEVDTARIAVGGSSGGGTQTIQLGAIEPRLAAIFPMVMDSMNGQGGCQCENAPLLRIGTNNVEISALAAPRFQGDCGATGDNTADFAFNGYPQIHQVYTVMGAPDNEEFWTVDAPHNHNVHSRELFYNYINKVFTLGLPSPIAEKPVEPVADPAHALSVWDAQHPMPADFGNAAVVRAYWTKSSDEQLAALESTPAEYRATLKTALEAMVVDQLPASSDVTAITEDRPNDRAFTWRGTLSRKDAGERIPCEIVDAPQPNGTVIIWVDPRGTAVLDDFTGPVDRPLNLFPAGGAKIIAIDPFESPNFHRPTPLPALGGRNAYAGFSLGYERTILANRVRDLLTTIAYARGLPGIKSVRILATADAAPQALLAAALAGDAVTRTAIDLHGFDFDKVTETNDPNFLPGALKYGGIYAFAPLIADTQRKALLTGARNTGKYALAAKSEGLTVAPTEQSSAELAKWLLQ